MSGVGYVPTYHTTPSFRGGLAGTRRYKLGEDVVGNANRNARTGKGGYDPAVIHVVLHPLPSVVPGPNLERYGGQFDNLRRSDGG